MTRLHRRSFLISATAAGALAHNARALTDRPGSAQRTPQPMLTGPIPRAERDYPIAAKPFWEVEVSDGFWAPKIEINAKVTIPFEIDKLKQIERGLAGGVLEAAIFNLKTHDNPAMRRHVEERVRALATGQSPVTTNRTFEVAVSHYQLTGRRELLDKAIEAASAIDADFRNNDPPFSGGERDSLACAQLYRATGDQKHLALAKHYLDIRGRPDSVGRSRHNQSHMPVIEQREAVGHAVNCVTLALSALDLGMLANIPGYIEAGRAMWDDTVRTKLYITGGIGSTGNEGFGVPYYLPNISAYSETCAVLMFMTLCHRLFLATGDAGYIDVMERSMYNNTLSGVSASGDHFFYVNRLASAGDGRDQRWQHAALECCPPNLVRFMASMPGYIYAQGEDQAIYINLYVAGSTAFEIGGQRLTLTTESGLPWAGRSRITVSTDAPMRAAIKLRIPGWARNVPAPGGLYAYVGELSGRANIAVNGNPVSAPPDALGYVTLDRDWASGDRIDLDFPVEVRRVVADERVHEARSRIAIERGPIVYCAEFPEIEDGHALDVLLVRGATLTPASDHKDFAGIVVLDTVARRASQPSAPARPVRLIPYYLWANRGAGEMSVWLSEREYAPGDVGPAGGLIFYRNPNFAEDGWCYLEAAPFDQSLGAQWGCFRHEIPGAAGTAIGTGRQNTADMLAACKATGEMSAAHLCTSLSVSGITGWFLPSRDELAEMYQALRATGVGDFRDQGMIDNCQYWTSSQLDSDMASHIDFADNGRLHGDDKDFPRRVRAVRAL